MVRSVELVGLPSTPEPSPPGACRADAARQARLRRRRVDLLHNLFTTAPAASRVPQVTTILDVIYKRFPETHGGVLEQGPGRARLGGRAPLGARDRDLRGGKTDIVRFLGVPLDRVDVTYLGPALQGGHGERSRRPAGARARGTDRAHRLGQASTQESRAAARGLRRADGDSVLVVPGYETSFEAELRRKAGDRVRFTGWLADDLLDGLYRAATCLVFPSLAEGFGLPILDALVRGTPVATSNATSLPEVAGDAALYFDPEDTDAIAAAIRRLLDDEALRERLRAAGPAQAAKFSWARTAEGTLESYRRALALDEDRHRRARGDRGLRGPRPRHSRAAPGARPAGRMTTNTCSSAGPRGLKRSASGSSGGFAAFRIPPGTSGQGLDAGRRSQAFLSTNSYLTAWFTRVPTAVIVYDTIAWEAPDSAQRRAQRIERATIRPGLRRADAAICISEATRRDLVARFPSVRAKASVVPLAAAARFHEAAPRQRAGFVLCVGTLEPRKNLVRAIQAHGGLPAETQVRHPLVIAGAKGWEDDQILRDAERAGARILTDVSEEELVDLYARCAVFLYPSLYEGFGLPLLEAMSTGAACITSNVSSLPEVGGDAVLYVDPRSVEGIGDALAGLLGSPDSAGAGRPRPGSSGGILLGPDGRRRASDAGPDRIRLQLSCARRRCQRDHPRRSGRCRRAARSLSLR